MYKQAQRIIDRFGGAPRVATALRKDVSAIYKWLYEKDRGGTDGLVPSSAVPEVMKAADALGIEFQPGDWDPS